MEFDLYGDIGGDDSKLSSASARTFLKSSADAKALTIRIKSSGGDVLEGMSIYNMLAGHPGKKTVIVDGLAASIASLIAMAGDEIHMIEGSFMMIHNPYAVTKGESSDLRRTADVLDKMAKSMVAVYAERTGLAKEEVLEMMNAETWMSAREAVEKGFASKVIKSKSKLMAQESGAYAQLSTFANVPQELLKFVSRNPESEATNIVSQEQTNKGNETMADSEKAEPAAKPEEQAPDFAKKFADLEEKVNSLAKFLQDKKAESDAECVADEEEESEEPEEGDEEEAPVDEDSEEEGDEEKEEMEMKDKTDVKTVAKGNKHMAALAEATKMVAQLSAKLEAVEKGKFEARVADAIKSGQLLPSQKNWALALSVSDFDAYLEAMGDVRFPLGKEHKEDIKAATELAGQAELTKEEKILAKGMGFSDEEVIAYNKKNPLKK